MTKKKETKHLKNWMRSLRESDYSSILTHRIPDLSYEWGASNKRPFDCFLFLSTVHQLNPHPITRMDVIPCEAKYQFGGKTFNLARWAEGPQGHQYTNLMKYYHRGASSILVIFWKKKNRIHPKVFPITDKIELVPIPLEILPTVKTVCELREVLKLSGSPLKPINSTPRVSPESESFIRRGFPK